MERDTSRIQDYVKNFKQQNKEKSFDRDAEYAKIKKHTEKNKTRQNNNVNAVDTKYKQIQDNVRSSAEKQLGKSVDQNSLNVFVKTHIRNNYKGEEKDQLLQKHQQKMSEREKMYDSANKKYGNINNVLNKEVDYQHVDMSIKMHIKKHYSGDEKEMLLQKHKDVQNQKKNIDNNEEKETHKNIVELTKKEGVQPVGAGFKKKDVVSAINNNVANKEQKEKMIDYVNANVKRADRVGERKNTTKKDTEINKKDTTNVNSDPGLNTQNKKPDHPQVEHPSNKKTTTQTSEKFVEHTGVAVDLNGNGLNHNNNVNEIYETEPPDFNAVNDVDNNSVLLKEAEFASNALNKVNESQKTTLFNNNELNNSNYTAEQRQDIWDIQDKYINNKVNLIFAENQTSAGKYDYYKIEADIADRNDNRERDLLYNAADKKRKRLDEEAEGPTPRLTPHDLSRKSSLMINEGRVGHKKMTTNQQNQLENADSNYKDALYKIKFENADPSEVKRNLKAHGHYIEDE